MVTLFAVVTCCMPFNAPVRLATPEETRRAHLYHIFQSRMPDVDFLSTDFVDLVTTILFRPAQWQNRPGVAEILQHPFCAATSAAHSATATAAKAIIPFSPMLSPILDDEESDRWWQTTGRMMYV